MKEFDFIIAGSGAAGLQMAWHMSHDEFFSSKRILLIDKEVKQENDRTWCFWERGPGPWDGILAHSWKKAQFRSDFTDKTFDLGEYTYKMLRSSWFYRFVFQRLDQCDNFTRVISHVDTIESFDDHVIVRCGESEYRGGYCMTSIADLHEAKNSSSHPWLLQHFKGWFIRTEQPSFDPVKVIMMDFKVPQRNNTRFMYVLPTDEKNALVEYTLFSKDLLPDSEYEEAIRDYLSEMGIVSYEITEVERGVIPMTTHPFHHKNERRTIYIGTAGGWTKASTGYTFYHAGKKARLLCDFLKTGKDLRKFHEPGRFVFYDHVVLDLLLRQNECGAEFFSSIYSRQSIGSIFDFLNEETSLAEEIRIIMSSSPRGSLVRSVVNVLMHRD